MLPCPNCGVLTEDTARFCHMCGQRITTVVAPPPPVPAPVPDPPSRRGRWFLLGILLSIVLLGILAAVWFTTFNDPAPGPNDSGSDVGGSSDPAAILASAASTRLTVEVFNCAGCRIVALPADGSSPVSAAVSGDRASFTLPSRKTLGLSFQFVHPAGFGAHNGANIAVLSPAGTGPGLAVGAFDQIRAARAGVCWAGTSQSKLTLTMVVEPFSDGTSQGNLRAWADPALPVLPAATGLSEQGTIEEPAVDQCANAYTRASTDRF